MVVLGIDPGYAIVGYGAVEFAGSNCRSLGYGVITTNAETDFNLRLKTIYDNCSLLIAKCKPDCMAIEKLYFQSNQKTAIMVAEARGVIILAAQNAGVDIFEYTPLQVKTVVTGYGKAKKAQVMEMTRRLLKLTEVPKPDDAADALAIALCHTQAAGTALRRTLVERNKTKYQ
ncbi:MAG: crossover junction endodeoxyribonuclease RuvC [Oscillospiraceae bacterium]|jgi:crossover junction endodeoxyribonuclease RuvC|nr:crossover junction endodeoxyribonuclease RuvC [Oscillospiraceae bacterium]